MLKSTRVYKINLSNFESCRPGAFLTMEKGQPYGVLIYKIHFPRPVTLVAEAGNLDWGPPQVWGERIGKEGHTRMGVSLQIPGKTPTGQAA